MIIKRNKQKRTHKELVDTAERWLQNRCGFVFKELATFSIEIPDAIGFRHDTSILIECKTSRQDFKKDQTKIFRRNPELGVGVFRFYMCEKGIIKIEDLPEKWGLLYVTEKGFVKVQKGPIGNTWCDTAFMFPPDLQAEKSLMYSALRRIYLQGVLPLIYQRFRKE